MTSTRNSTGWKEHMAAWSSPPVDDVGYISSEAMRNLPDPALKKIIAEMHHTRYTGWRNADGRWRAMMGLDSTQFKDVLDYGTGTGLEALEYARKRNGVSVADISMGNILLASKVLNAYDYCAKRTSLIYPDGKTGFLPGIFDVFHANGVIHHSKNPVLIMKEAHRLLVTGGEARIMVYSDRGWRKYIGTEPPAKVEEDPDFHKFVRTFDQVGEYADWYDEEKIDRLFGDLFAIAKFSYLCDDDRYCAAVLRKKWAIVK